MDSDGIALWEAKRKQHRERRQWLYDQCLGAMNARGILQGGATIEQLYDTGTEYNGNLVLHWRDFFNDYWRRESPAAPAQEAEGARQEIGSIIAEEEKLIDEEIQGILRKVGITFVDANLAPGRSRLRMSCDVLKGRCFAEIKTLERLRMAALAREQEDEARRWTNRWKDTGASLLVAVAAAGMGAWAMDYFSKEQIAIYKEAAGDIRGLRSAHESLQKELGDLRSDYRLVVKWLLKTPEQIDVEIGRLGKDLERTKRKITEDFAEKRANHISDMTRRGMVNSSIHEGGLKEIENEEKEAVKEAEEEARRKVDDLKEQKRKLDRRK